MNIEWPADEPHADDLPPARAIAAHIRNALALRYEPNAHALLWEVANGTGSSGRTFADAVSFGLWPSHGHLIEGIEIKVSRSDFLHEMKRPDKSFPVYRYCHRWWLATPMGMVKPEELPPTWGLLELTSTGALRAKVKAPLLTPEEPSMSFVAALLRRHAGRDDDMYRVAREAELSKMRADIEEHGKREFERERHRRQEEVLRANETILAIKDATGIDFASYRTAKPDPFIAAIKFLTDSNWTAEFTADRIKQLRNTLTAAVKGIDAFLPDSVPGGDA